MTNFSVVSARLEVEILASQQRMREAFSNTESAAAKKMHKELEDLQEVCVVLFSPSLLPPTHTCTRARTQTHTHTHTLHSHTIIIIINKSVSHISEN